MHEKMKGIMTKQKPYERKNINNGTEVYNARTEKLSRELQG